MFDKKYLINKVKQHQLYKHLMKMLPEEERKEVERRVHGYAGYIHKSMLEPVLEANVDNEKMEKIRKTLDEKIKQGKVTREKDGTPLKPKE